MIVQIMKSETTNSLFAAPLDALTSSRQRYKNMSDEEKEKAAKVRFHSYVIHVHFTDKSKETLGR